MNFAASCGIQKSNLISISQFLITFFFIADAYTLLSDRFNLQDKVNIVSHGLYNQQVRLQNSGINFNLTQTFDDEFLTLVLWLAAIVQILCGACLNFHEGPFLRRVATMTLIAILVVIDTLLVNFPKSSEPVIYANEVMNCTANLAIGGGLLMIMGLRDQPRRLV